MKISDLKREIEDVPDDADLLVYTGPTGTFVQAEWIPVKTGMGMKRIIDSAVVPGAGGPTVVPGNRGRRVTSVAGERSRLAPGMIG